MERTMNKIAATILALGLLGSTATIATARPAVGIHIGGVGIGVGVGRYHHGGRYYHHRHMERGHYRYW
jgi:hypothetical protein